MTVLNNRDVQEGACPHAPLNPTHPTLSGLWPAALLALLCSLFLQLSCTKDRPTPTRFTASKLFSAEQVIATALLDPAARPHAEAIAHNIRTYDDRALRIAALAHDTSYPESQRATACARAILETYYPEESHKIARIVYEPSLTGMAVTPIGRSDALRGKLVLGRASLAQMPTMLAAEVLRVGHELQHLEQYQRGLHGRKHRHEAEFLAFYWEALAEPPAGTGVVAHAKRVSWCEEGLKHFGKLDPESQAIYKAKYEQLAKMKSELTQRRKDATF